MTELLAVITITILAVISPGPDFAMVSRNSLILSRRAGLLTAFGIGTGIIIHVSYTLIGLGVLLQQSLWMFNAIKFAGAIYLIYLGIRMLRTKQEDVISDNSVASMSDLAAFRTGFLTNVLNPKTLIFIVSLFMQVIKPETPLITQIYYGIFISLMHMFWFSLVALCFSAGPIRSQLIAIRHWIDRTFGGLLVIFGTLLAVASRSR